MEVVAEFENLAEARAAELMVDAVVVAGDLETANTSGEHDELVEPLTAREVEVLELASEGLANKAIAHRLDISDQTVKFHIASILGKLGAANRTEAVRVALRRGLITI
jgi:DNA-binding NarL/FixJ family response regulator